MLRPTIFMQHLLIVPGLYEAGDDRIYLPTGDAGVAFLDCRDIAYAAYRILTDPSRADVLDEDFFLFTGPEALTGSELVQELSRLNGKTFTQVKEEEAFVAHSKKVGSPTELQAVYQAGAQGAFAKVHTEMFERVTGKKPNSFAKFAYDYQYYFS